MFYAIVFLDRAIQGYLYHVWTAYMHYLKILLTFIARLFYIFENVVLVIKNHLFQCLKGKCDANRDVC